MGRACERSRRGSCIETLGCKIDVLEAYQRVSEHTFNPSASWLLSLSSIFTSTEMFLAWLFFHLKMVIGRRYMLFTKEVSTRAVGKKDWISRALSDI